MKSINNTRQTIVPTTQLDIIGVSDATFIIKDEIVITGTLNLSSNCALIFEGGIFTGSGTIQGNDTLIDAPPMAIFGNAVVITGSWNVTVAYPEWIESDVDDAIRINKAISLLSSTRGGVIKLTGTYNIFSSILVPSFVYLEGSNPFKAEINLPTNGSGNWTIPDNCSKGCAIYFRVSQLINKACGIRGLWLRLHNNQVNGIYVERAYDQSIWENVEVSGTHADYSAFYFTVKNDSNIGQTVLLTNCIGYRYDNYPSQKPYPDWTPIFYFKKYQETNLIGCKAFASKDSSNSTDGVGFHFDGCRGVVMDGCTSAFAYCGVLITSTPQTTDGITISGFTSEKTSHYDVYAKGATNVIRTLTVLPIRHESSHGDIYLEKCHNSVIISSNPGQLVYTKNSGYHNTIISTEPILDLNNDTPVVGTPIGNSNILIPNYNTERGQRFLQRITVAGTEDQPINILDPDTGAIIKPKKYESVSIMSLNSTGEILLNRTRKLLLTQSQTIVDKLPSVDGVFVVRDSNNRTILKSVTDVDNDSTSLSIRVNKNGSYYEKQILLSDADALGHRGLCVDGYTPSRHSGLSTNLPIDGLYPGYFYYAIDLTKPIWYTGSIWIDADGQVI